jgi:hypothetical protein
MCDATIGAEELADISSYQLLPADKIQKSIKLARISSKKQAHICATGGKQLDS